MNLWKYKYLYGNCTDGKDYDSSTPPKDAGSYQLVISVPVNALDKEIQTGQTIPSLTNPVKDTDNNVTGTEQGENVQQPDKNKPYLAGD